jgi:hypothetical protein
VSQHHTRTDPRPFVRLIKENVPEISIRRARPIDTGWACFVLEVNDEWMCKFPRTPLDARNVERELELLHEVEKRLHVDVPHVEHVVSGGSGLPLLAIYRKIRGRPLPRRDLVGRRAKTWASDLVTVCDDLERFPISLGKRLGVRWSSAPDRMSRWQEMYPLVRRLVHPLLEADERSRDAAYWEEYMSDLAHARAKPVFNHGDLFPEHILVSDDGVLGIIDWEDTCFEDPVGNVTGLPAADGFAARVAKELFAGRDQEYPQRLAFHRHASPAYSIFRGVEEREPKLLKWGLRGYRGTLPR